MTFSVRQCPDAAAFLVQAGPFLLREEAAHNLLLGIASVARDDPAQYPDGSYFAVIVDTAGVVVGAMMRTRPHNLLLSRVPPDAIPAMTAAIREEEGSLPGLVAPAEIAPVFAAEWQRRSAQPFARVHAERIYALTQVTPPERAAGVARRAGVADRDLLLAWYAAFVAEAGLGGDATADAREVDFRLCAAPEVGGLWLWEVAGRPVSLAGYSGPTAHGIRVGPVYTPPEHRRHGYAAANVAALSQWLLDGGRHYCFLFTDLANPTANQLYMRLGYHPVCDVDAYAFAPAPIAHRAVIEDAR